MTTSFNAIASTTSYFDRTLTPSWSVKQSDLLLKVCANINAFRASVVELPIPLIKSHAGLFSGKKSRRVWENSFSTFPNTSRLLSSNTRHYTTSTLPLRSQHSRNISVFDFFDKNISAVKPSKTFELRINAFGIPNSKNPIQLSINAHSHPCGEDAYFSRHDALGIADGVGGWNGIPGANVALYSSSLMDYACQEIEKYDNVEDDDTALVYDYMSLDPQEILSKAFSQVSSALIGSSTALVVVIRDDELRIANLGDCAVMVVRDGRVVFKSVEMQHSFNFPYQLGTGSRDSPLDAQLYVVSIQRGDLVIAGSDGLFDNLYDEEILAILQSHTQAAPTRTSKKLGTDVLAKAIAVRAREVSEDQRSSTPFSARASNEGLYFR